MNVCLFISIVFFSLISISDLFSAELTVGNQSDVKTVSRALELADDGDTIHVYSGTYKEHLEVNKSVKLYGIGRPVLDGGGQGTVITVKAKGVVIDGFTVKSSGSSLSMEDCGIELEESAGSTINNNILEDVLFGIYIKNSANSILSNNIITGKDLSLPDRGDGVRLWYSSDTKVLNNKLVDTRDLVIWWSSNTLIKGNVVKNGRYGLHYMYSNHNRFESNLFEGNAVGGFLMYSRDITFFDNIFAKNQGLASGYGVGFKDLDDIVAIGNIFIDNRIGIYADNSPHSFKSWNKITENVIAFNDIGVSMMPSIERNQIIQNSFIENYEHVEIRGGGKLKGNKWYDQGSGNYWSNYPGYDSDNDGIGDIPFVYESLFENIIDKNPELRLFIYSPASQAIELASEAIPIIKPVPKLTDMYPLSLPNLPDKAKNSNDNKFPFQFLILTFAVFFIPLVFYVYIVKSGVIKSDQY